MKLNKKLITLIMAVATLTISGCGAVTEKSSSSTPNENSGPSSATPVIVPSSYEPTPIIPSSYEPTPIIPGGDSVEVSPKAKKAFKKLDNLSDYNVNVYDATSLGLSKNSKAARKLRKRLSDEGESSQEDITDNDPQEEEDDEEFETTFSLVKTTSENKTDAVVNEDGTLDVSFTKIDTTVTTKTTTGQRKLTAVHERDESDEVTIKEYGTDTITFNSDEKHEYRVVDALGNVHQDWTKGNEGTTTTDHLPVNDSRGWDDFILYEREVSFCPAMTYNVTYGNDYIAIMYWNSLEDATQTKYYEYRILDGDEDNVVFDWAQFPDGEKDTICTEKRIYFDQMPENPVVQYRQITRKKDFAKKTYITYKFNPIGNDSISFLSRGKFSTSSDGSYGYAQYRLEDKGGNVIIDWTGDSEAKLDDFVVFDNIPYVEPKAIDTYSIELRSIDANISFAAYEGFKYSVFDKEGNVILDKVEATSDKNISKDESMVTFGGLRDGEEYLLKYEGIGEEIVVEQTKIGGEIDKMYVYSSQFTFASFVPYGTSQRPSDDELVYDSDGIAIYDKTDYYSDESRLSFVFDNYTGYIYLIENFKASYIHNGLLTSKDDHFVYDFEIDDDNNLVIYALFSNPSVIYTDFAKDKYGNKYIKNNILAEYDEDTNTQYYIGKSSQDLLIKLYSYGRYNETNNLSLAYDNCIHQYDWDMSEIMKGVYSIYDREDVKEMYFYTRDHEMVTIKLYGTGSWIAIKEAYIVTDNGKRYVTEDDDICVSDYSNTLIIRHGLALVLPLSNLKNDFGDGNNYNSNNIFITDFNRNIVSHMEYAGVAFNAYYLEKYNTILMYDRANKVLRSWEFDNIYESATFYIGGFITRDGEIIKSSYKLDPKEVMSTVLTNATINDTYNAFVSHGVSGTVSYDIIVEEKDGETVVSKYVTGTYEAPEIKIVLQPINR